MLNFHLTVSEYLNTFLHWFAFLFFTLFLCSIFYAFYKTIRALFCKTKTAFNSIIKENFDKYILIGLKFLIIANIINIIIETNLKNILIVFIIVIIREIMKWEVKISS
ncbi:DUF1622 domain-containing protein [Cetobacterium sp.]|uniref:DUF1622 domain-containing protein n=1 Tax=Cetobacterium sp. TaxID=2071632 RepID=UPI003AEF19F4